MRLFKLTSFKMPQKKESKEKTMEGCWDCLHPSMPHHCSLDGNHRTQTSSCGRDSSKLQHLALWQTEQAVALVALELPLGLSQSMAADGGSGFVSPFSFSIFLLYLLGIRSFPLFHKQMLPSEAWWLFPLTQLYLGKYFLSTSYIPYRSRKIGKRPGISKPRFLLHTPPAERIRN